MFSTGAELLMIEKLRSQGVFQQPV